MKIILAVLLFDLIIIPFVNHDDNRELKLEEPILIITRGEHSQKIMTYEELMLEFKKTKDIVDTVNIKIDKLINQNKL